VLLLLAAPALADKRQEADALFKKAKKLHGDKQYAEACPMFEKSDKLDPGIGAKLNVAKCYEDWGMLARAHRWYTDAEAMARAASDPRADKIKELIETIDADVPRLTFKLPPNVDAKAIELKLDGKPAADLVGKQQRLDPGPHELTWVVDGQKKSRMIPMERGGERDITLDVRAVASRKPQPAGDDAPSPGRTRRILGIVSGATGIVGLGVATYLTLDARSSYNDALDTHCMGMTNLCNDEGVKITSDARSQANIATIVTVVSLAAIGGGIALYLTAPKGEPKEANRTVYVTPVVGDGVGGIVVGGGF
jgi:hypothetical protein